MASNLSRRHEGREHQGTLSRREPYRAFREMDPFGLMREMMRWDPFAELEANIAPEAAFLPKTDVKEKADAFDIAVELPGVDQEDIEISCIGNRLTISGEREEEAREENERYYTWERSCGHFSRSFTLPESAEIEKVKAELKDGVLHVTVPKKESVQAKRIPIGAKSGGEQAKTEQEEAQAQKQPEQKQGREPSQQQVKVEKKAA